MCDSGFTANLDTPTCDGETTFQRKKHLGIFPDIHLLTSGNAGLGDVEEKEKKESINQSMILIEIMMSWLSDQSVSEVHKAAVRAAMLDSLEQLGFIVGE